MSRRVSAERVWEALPQDAEVTCDAVEHPAFARLGGLFSFHLKRRDDAPGRASYALGAAVWERRAAEGTTHVVGAGEFVALRHVRRSRRPTGIVCVTRDGARWFIPAVGDIPKHVFDATTEALVEQATPIWDFFEELSACDAVTVESDLFDGFDVLAAKVRPGRNVQDVEHEFWAHPVEIVIRAPFAPLARWAEGVIRANISAEAPQAPKPKHEVGGRPRRTDYDELARLKLADSPAFESAFASLVERETARRVAKGLDAVTARRRAEESVRRSLYDRVERLKAERERRRAQLPPHLQVDF